MDFAHDAMILVGGKGTRLQSVVSSLPKPMAPVAGRPFVEWLVLSLRNQGIRRLILCTGHKGEMIEAYFGDGHSLDVEVSYCRDPFPLGTGGGVKHALDLVQGQRFFVLNGDSYCRVDFRRLAEAHLVRRAKATIWAVRQDDCRRYGSVDVSEDGAVLAFHEKSLEARAGLINAGVYMLERHTAASIPSNRAVSLEREVFPQMIGRGLYAEIGGGTFIDIGVPEAYVSAEGFFATEKRYVTI
jgi:NDP-sugar pyrophosphorylase family protein